MHLGNKSLVVHKRAYTCQLPLGIGPRALFIHSELESPKHHHFIIHGMVLRALHMQALYPLDTSPATITAIITVIILITVFTMLGMSPKALH